jgi:hypothetical protein
LPDKRSGSLEILRKVGVRNKEMMTTNLSDFTSIYTELPDGIYDLTGDYLVPNDAFQVEDYPELMSYEWSEVSKITKPQIKLLQRLAKFCSQDTTRPVLCSIKIKDGKAYASDGYKLMRVDMNLPDCFISPKFVRRLSTHSEWQFRVAGEEAINAGTHGVDIYEKQVTGTIPKYDTLYPKKEPQKYIVVNPNKEWEYTFDGTSQAKIVMLGKEDTIIDTTEVFEPKECDEDIIVMPLAGYTKDGTIRIPGEQLVKIGKEVAVFFGEDRTKPVYAKMIK